MRHLFAALISAACALLASAQDFRITEAPKDEQVLQRSWDGTATVALRGTLTGKRTNGKTIEARVVGPKGVLPDLDWAPLGKVLKQSWNGDLRGLPSGGPYRIEARVQGTSGSTLTIENLLVGDLWVLAGQSNMEGLGDLIDVQPPDPMVHSFDMADRWVVAEEPLHTLPGAADPVHWRTDAQGEPERWTGERLQRYMQERKKGAGVGLPFAVEMVKRTGVPVGLIPCAHNGTSMAQWSPALKDRGGESLYGSMYRRVQAVGGKVRGVLWYQGESDANPAAAPQFKQRFEEFVKAVRSDLGQPDLPFYYVQIGRNISDTNISEWNAIQEAQREAELELPNLGMIPSIDLALDGPIHIGTEGLKVLGKRLADRAGHDLFPRLKDFGELKTGPRPVSAVYTEGVIKVDFTGVNGRLLADGRISGFTIHDGNGPPVSLIYKIGIDPAEASTVLLYVAGKLPEKAVLRYGFGKDPYCNLHDAHDMTVPVFGPMPVRLITGARANQDFKRNLSRQAAEQK